MSKQFFKQKKNHSIWNVEKIDIWKRAFLGRGKGRGLAFGPPFGIFQLGKCPKKIIGNLDFLENLVKLGDLRKLGYLWKLGDMRIAHLVPSRKVRIVRLG